MKKTGKNTGAFGMGGAQFGVAKNSLNGMMDIYGDLDGEAKAPQPKKPTPAKAPIGNVGTKPAPSKVVKVGSTAAPVRSGAAMTKAPVTQVTRPTLGTTAPKTLNGRKATMSLKSIEALLGELKATIKPVSGDLGKIISEHNVLSKTGLNLFDFSEAGHTAEAITDDQLNSQYEKMAKAKDIYEYPSLTFNVSPVNLRQGQLGDCYILGSMSVIANHPANITRLMEDKGDSAEVWLCDSGCWRQIKLLKTFPVSGSKPLFASSKDNCIWQMVLEKAFACMYKGYDRLELGHSSVALRELTGCATEYIELENPTQAWQSLKDHLANKYIITGSSKVNGLQDASITPKHCYAILDAKEATIGGKQIKFLRLMNPVSQYTQPPTLNADVIKQLGSGQTSDVFWYQYASLLKNFEVLTCCKIKAELCYSWSRVKNPGQKQNCSIFKMVGTVGDTINLSFNHKNLRHYVQQNLDSIMKTKYGVARIVAFTFGGDSGIEILGSGFHALQNVKVDFKLEKAAEFFVFVDIDYTQSYLDEYSVAVSSSNPVYIEKESGTQSWLSAGTNKVDFIKVLMYQVAMHGSKMQVSRTSEVKFTLNEYNKKSGIKLPLMVRHYGQSLGYIAFVYSNKTDDVTLEESLIPAELKNVHEYWPAGVKIGNISLVLKPGDIEVILLKFGSDNNCSHTSRIQSKYVLHF